MRLLFLFFFFLSFRCVAGVVQWFESIKRSWREWRGASLCVFWIRDGGCESAERERLERASLMNVVCGWYLLPPYRGRQIFISRINKYMKIRFNKVSSVFIYSQKDKAYFQQYLVLYCRAPIPGCGHKFRKTKFYFQTTQQKKVTFRSAQRKDKRSKVNSLSAGQKVVEVAYTSRPARSILSRPNKSASERRQSVYNDSVNKKRKTP